MLLKDISREQIEQTIEKSEMIATLLKKELEFREKFSGVEADERRLGIKKDKDVATELNKRLRA